MFESLDEEIKSREGNGETATGRVVRFLVIAVVSLVLFGALVAGIALLE
jgi:hypothetical protein